MSAPHRDRMMVTLKARDREPLARRAHLEVMRHLDAIERVHDMTWQLTRGDFESLVIWCQLSRLSVSESSGNGCSDEPSQSRYLHLQELSMLTCIPRETVRRKLEKLAALGRVQRTVSGWVVCMGPMKSTHRPIWAHRHWRGQHMS